MSWVKIDIANVDGTKASDGVYYLRFNKGWLPREAVVEAGTSGIPLRHTGDQSYLLQPNMKLGVGGAPLVKGDLSTAKILPTASKTVNAVEATAPSIAKPCDPPQEISASLDTDQRAAFVRLWQRVPPHLHAIYFEFEKEPWTAADIDALGDLLCKFEHRFCQHITDLGHITVDPFRIILKRDARPVKQRPYRHSPVLAAKVQTETDKLVLAGILCRSYSNWSSPFVVIADGRIKITCNYRRVNEQSVVPVLSCLCQRLMTYWLTWAGPMFFARWI